MSCCLSTSRLLTALAMMAILAGCESRQVYQAIQENRWRACEEQPIPQQAACRSQYEMSYREYEGLRQAYQAGVQAQEGRTENR
jgi:hypothetical protein